MSILQSKADLPDFRHLTKVIFGLLMLKLKHAKRWHTQPNYAPDLQNAYWRSCYRLAKLVHVIYVQLQFCFRTVAANSVKMGKSS